MADALIMDNTYTAPVSARRRASLPIAAELGPDGEVIGAEDIAHTFGIQTPSASSRNSVTPRNHNNNNSNHGIGGSGSDGVRGDALLSPVLSPSTGKAFPRLARRLQAKTATVSLVSPLTGRLNGGNMNGHVVDEGSSVDLPLSFGTAETTVAVSLLTSPPRNITAQKSPHDITIPPIRSKISPHDMISSRSSRLVEGATPRSFDEGAEVRVAGLRETAPNSGKTSTQHDTNTTNTSPTVYSPKEIDTEQEVRLTRGIDYAAVLNSVRAGRAGRSADSQNNAINTTQQQFPSRSYDTRLDLNDGDEDSDAAAGSGLAAGVRLAPLSVLSLPVANSGQNSVKTPDTTQHISDNYGRNTSKSAYIGSDTSRGSGGVGEGVDTGLKDALSPPHRRNYTHSYNNNNNNMITSLAPPSSHTPTPLVTSADGDNTYGDGMDAEAGTSPLPRAGAGRSPAENNENANENEHDIDVQRIAAMPAFVALNAAAVADIDADVLEINGYTAGNVQGRHEFKKTSVLPDTAAMLPTFAPGSPFDVALQAKVIKEKRIHKPEALKRLQQGDEEFERKKAAKALGKIINKEHKQYQTSFGMMLGIYTSVVNTQVGAEKMLLEDFMKVRKLVFPPSGSPLTPPHALPTSFKFKDYAPKVFHHLRQRFAIDQKHYLSSLGGAYEYIEFNSNSKSGSFFFYSHDGKFMIKTQSPAESKFLRRILAHYYQYVMTHPHTYITRFYGMHRIKMPHLRKKIHFVVMQSVFYGDNDIHEMYDLKGSTVGRAATDKEKARGPSKCVYKDLDLMHSGKTIKLGPGRREAFLEQIRQDAEFLHRMQIMDYSLLLGIHYKSQRATGAPHALVHASSPKGPGDEESKSPDVIEAVVGVTRSRGASGFDGGTGITPREDDGTTVQDGPDTRRHMRSSSADLAVFSPGKLMTAAFGEAATALRYVSEPRSAASIITEATVARGGGVVGLTHTHGITSAVVSRPVEPPHPTKEAGMGIYGLEDDGTTVTDEIYYLGIIDILQQYNLRKVGETAIRAVYQKFAGISSVGPGFYASRFVEFLKEHTS